jgi:hypothetical protein
MMLPKHLAQKERAQGLKVVRPGDRAFLPRAEWHRDTVASLSEDQAIVRLILLRAKVERQGALTRTLTRIRAIGMMPLIVEPLGSFAAHLRAKGWTPIATEDGFDNTEVVYYPPHILVCEHCNGFFEATRDETWDEKKAIAEMRMKFPDAKLEDCAVVCDPCYQIIMRQ